MVFWNNRPGNSHDELFAVMLAFMVLAGVVQRRLAAGVMYLWGPETVGGVNTGGVTAAISGTVGGDI